MGEGNMLYWSVWESECMRCIWYFKQSLEKNNHIYYTDIKNLLHYKHNKHNKHNKHKFKILNQ